nr:hypothetical protein [Tanacetum cinerariifolium]
GDSNEIGGSVNEVINGSCEKGKSTYVLNKNDEVLDVMDEFPTLEEALNIAQSTKYDGNLKMNMPMTENDTERIRAIASSLGMPLIKDKTTFKMCHDGTGRVGYARVLAEFNAKMFGHVDGRCSKQSNGVHVVGNKEQGNMDNGPFRNDFNTAKESNKNNVKTNKNREKRDSQRNNGTMNKGHNKAKVRNHKVSIIVVVSLIKGIGTTFLKHNTM